MLDPTLGTVFKCTQNELEQPHRVFHQSTAKHNAQLSLLLLLLPPHLENASLETAEEFMDRDSLSTCCY